MNTDSLTAFIKGEATDAQRVTLTNVAYEIDPDMMEDIHAYPMDNFSDMIGVVNDPLKFLRDLDGFNAYEDRFRFNGTNYESLSEGTYLEQINQFAAEIAELIVTEPSDAIAAVPELANLDGDE